MNWLELNWHPMISKKSFAPNHTSERTVTNPAFWLVVSAGKILLYLPTGHGNAFVRFCHCVYKSYNSFLYAKKVIYRLRVGSYSENLWPRSQFFTIRTSEPANNIYIYLSHWSIWWLFYFLDFSYITPDNSDYKVSRFKNTLKSITCSDFYQQLL